MDEQKQRSKIEQIRAEISGLERSRDAAHQLGSGIRMIADGLNEIGNAITDMLLVGIEDQLTDAKEHLALHTPDPDRLTQELMAANERVQQAEAYLARMMEGVAQVPEEYRGFLQLIMPVIEMQIQNARERVQYLREELEKIAPMPDATMTGPDAEEDPSEAMRRVEGGE